VLRKEPKPVSDIAGARCLAVATGSFDTDALRDAGADWVFADLSDTARVLDVLLN
jgi:phosphoglycolate phosphatase-like HAD superfamily hydrolase